MSSSSVRDKRIIFCPAPGKKQMCDSKQAGVHFIQVTVTDRIKNKDGYVHLNKP